MKANANIFHERKNKQRYNSIEKINSNNNNKYLKSISNFNKSIKIDFEIENISDISMDDDIPSLSFFQNDNTFYPNITKLSHKKEYNNNSYNKKRIDPFIKNQIKILISYYLFVLQLENKIEKSKTNGIKVYECYLINEKWLNNFKDYYLYSELVKEIENIGPNSKTEEKIYSQLSQQYLEKIKLKNKNFIHNFDYLRGEEKLFLDYKNKIKYAMEFNLINNDIYNKIHKNIKVQYFSKKEYIINNGMIIIKFEYNSKNLYELLIGNYHFKKDKFNPRELFYYYNKEEMESNFEILTYTDYSKFKSNRISIDKNIQYIINGNANHKVGIIYNLNLNENLSSKENDGNYFRNNIQSEKKDFLINRKKENIIFNQFNDYNNINTEIEFDKNEKYKNKEDFDSKTNRFEIEFDSFSFCTTLPIPQLSCINCKSEIELVNIYFNKQNEEDIIIFNCLGTCGKIDISIKEYLIKFILNTYLYEKCYSCKKIQINSENSIFNYCFDCHKIYCEHCFYKHNCFKYNNSIKINYINSKCLIHKNKDLNSFCYEDKKKLCEECLNDGSHLNHYSKLLLSEILPIKIDNKNLENEIFQNIMDDFQQKINHINENKKLNIKEKFRKKQNEIKEKYNYIINNLKSEKKEKKNQIETISKNKEEKIEKIFNKKLIEEKNEIIEELKLLINNLEYNVNNSKVNGVKQKFKSFKNL